MPRVLNSRGLAYFNKGDEEHALADFDLALQTAAKFFQPLQQSRPDLHAPRRTAARLRRVQHRAFAQQRRRTATSTCSISAACRPCASNTSSALAYFAEGKQLNPEGWQIPNYRCITYAEMGRLDDALPIATRCWRSIRSWSGPLAGRGNVYRLKGDLDAALKDFNEAIKLSPNFVRAYVGRGQVYERRKRHGRRARRLPLGRRGADQSR